VKYDLEIVLSVCSKYSERIEDFKKYGLLNIRDKKVFLNILLSNEDIKDIEVGWPTEIEIKVIRKNSDDFIKNLYDFIFNLNPKEMESRWFMRVDDDSSTDVYGLIENLDKFYDYKSPYYLASGPSKFDAANMENYVLDNYISELKHYKEIINNLFHEIECCVISNFALCKIFENENSMNLLKKRSETEGSGATDVVLAFASSMAKIYPLDCPFLTPWPLISNFSLIGGIKNHIHLISRNGSGENFQDHSETSELRFLFFTKIVGGLQKSELIGKQFLLETEHELKLYKFEKDFRLKVKFSSDSNWFEHEEFVYVVEDENFIKLKRNGSDLFGENNFVLRGISEKLELT
jgi:hypothetical protein